MGPRTLPCHTGGRAAILGANHLLRRDVAREPRDLIPDAGTEHHLLSFFPGIDIRGVNVTVEPCPLCTGDALAAVVDAPTAAVFWKGSGRAGRMTAA